MYLQKVHVETFSEKNDQNFDVGFSSTFFCSIDFPGVLQRREFKKTTNSVLQTNRVEKFLQTNRQNNPKPIFSRFFLITFLGVSW
jgi:hypothetical protein